MDIYSYAESINWSADYIDMRTGRIYKIQEAGNMKKFFGILWRIIILVFSIVSFTLAYSQEETEAYRWAFRNWITTQSTIEAANLDWKLTRQELSKMLTNYIENVAWVRQTSLSFCTFPDEDKITDNLKPYTRKICSYKIMWSDWEDFRPTSKVTRAELWIKNALVRQT